MPLPATFPPALECETRNVPEVMGPWELGKHLRFLLDEALPHPQLEAVRAATERLLRTWAGLWALHGDATPAKPVYRRVFDEYLAAMRLAGGTILLANETRWIDGVTMMLSRAAVRTPMQRGAPAMA